MILVKSFPTKNLCYPFNVIELTIWNYYGILWEEKDDAVMNYYNFFTRENKNIKWQSENNIKRWMENIVMIVKWKDF